MDSKTIEMYATCSAANDFYKMVQDGGDYTDLMEFIDQYKKFFLYLVAGNGVKEQSKSDDETSDEDLIRELIEKDLYRSVSDDEFLCEIFGIDYELGF